MPELVVVVPSRGRPYTVAELALAFRETCTADTWLMFAVDESDPAAQEYVAQAFELGRNPYPIKVGARVVPSTTMVEALNTVALQVAGQFTDVSAVGFMGDDHRPRAGRIGVIDVDRGWDRRYLDALAAHPGIVYGDDLIQGPNLPTQCAMSASWVRALGHMAPPPLVHLYLDNYWLALGRATGCITYLPDVVVEHVHPVTGKVEWDEGHRRVNAPELYVKDKAAFEAYWAERGERDIAAVLGAAVSG